MSHQLLASESAASAASAASASAASAASATTTQSSGVYLAVIAATGACLHFQRNARVEDVVQAASAVTNTPPNEQVVVKQGVRLESGHELSAYDNAEDDDANANANANDVRIFVYDKTMLRGVAGAGDGEAVPAPAPPPPRVPFDDDDGDGDGDGDGENRQQSLLDDPACAPNVAAWPARLEPFALARARAARAWQRARTCVEYCQRTLDERDGQLMAADAARENVESHYHATVSSHDALVRAFVALREDERHAVAHLNDAISRASATQLHAALVTARRRDLLDYAGGEEKLRAEASALAARSDALNAKMQQLHELYTKLKSDVESLLLEEPPTEELAPPPPTTEENLSISGIVTSMVTMAIESAQAEERGERAFSDGRRSLRRCVGALLERVASDAPAFQRALNECDERIAALAANDESDGDEAAMASARDIMQPLENALAEGRALCTSCATAKALATATVYRQVRAVSALQVRIRDLRKRHVAYREAVSSARSSLRASALGRLPKMLAGYVDSLAEARRRSAVEASWRAEVERFLERMAEMRFTEARAREESLGRLVADGAVPVEMLERLGLISPEPPWLVEARPRGGILQNSREVTAEQVASAASALGLEKNDDGDGDGGGGI